MGMSDMEKTIKEMTVLRNWLLHMEEFNAHGNGDMYHWFGCTVYSALELLREQDAIKPIVNADGSFNCGNCGEPVGFDEHPFTCKVPEIAMKFCCECGKPVKWNV